MIISQTINIFSILFIFVLIGIIVLINNGYKKYFKNEIVGRIIKQYNQSLNYAPSGGFTEEEYKNCSFLESCDEFISSDYIYDVNNTFKYADITTYSVSEDSDGRSKTLSYSGSLICTSIRNVNCSIFLGSMIYYLSERVKNMKMDMENNEFNKVLPAYSNNEIEAYKILTPSVMNSLVEIYNSTYTDIDIRLFNNMLYIRFLSGDSFEPSLFNIKREKNSIYSSIAAFEEAIIVMNKVKEVINKNIQGGK